MAPTSGLRRFTALALALIGCLLAILSVVAVWSRNQLLDTDRYLDSVAPLANNAVIQDEVASKVSTAINNQLNSAADSRQLPVQLEILTQRLGGRVNTVVERQILAFVRSDAFADIWLEINRIGHEDLVSLLTDEGSSTVEVDNGRLVLNLSSVVQGARDRLAKAGLTVVTSLPPISLVIDIADAKDIEQARTAVTWLNRLAIVLPIVSLALLAASVVVRGSVRRRLVRPALMLAASMVVLWLLIRWGASLAADQVPTNIASNEAVHVYYTQLTSLLRHSTVVIGLIALAIAAAAAAWDAIGNRRGQEVSSTD